MSDESDDSDSSDSSRSSSRQRILTIAGIALCVIQFTFFVYTIVKFMEFDFSQGFKFMLLAYTSAFAYKGLENSGFNLFPLRN
ncbi:hypothetical protein FTO70_09330 [Methanosarcina sp. KYL-1]|nr:hypothetical protein [Methanosarcina sp. KYL-1]